MTLFATLDCLYDEMCNHQSLSEAIIPHDWVDVGRCTWMLLGYVHTKWTHSHRRFPFVCCGKTVHTGHGSWRGKMALARPKKDILVEREHPLKQSSHNILIWNWKCTTMIFIDFTDHGKRSTPCLKCNIWKKRAKQKLYWCVNTVIHLFLKER